jgi:hypothetical protein
MSGRTSAVPAAAAETTISAAIAYGVTLDAAFDLHRFDLLEALHLPLPLDRKTERIFNKDLSDSLRQGVQVNFRYTHGVQERREYEAEGKESQSASLSDAQR